MLIKLNTSNFTFENIASRTEKKAHNALTKADWIRVDKIVMVLMVLIAIVSSLVFS
ncbi:hypothetical protein ABIB40_003089 [Pedobacter sp. UYP30]|uniref:hypothetical protein n=1 Tax=Pedobacter sp. UYP30 TaxID=1756400 RepID=UPI00339A2467